MKLKMISFLIILGIVAATAQSKNAIQKVYDKYEDSENVLSFSFSKDLKDVLDGDFDWGDDLKNIEGDLSKMSTLIVSESKDSRKMLKDIEKMIRKLGYTSTKVKDDENESEEGLIFTRGKKGHYSEIHMLITDDDGSGVLVSAFGDFTVTDAE